MLLIDEDELIQIRDRSYRWERKQALDRRKGRPHATAGTAHDRMRLLEMLDLMRAKLAKALEGSSNA